MCAVAVEWHEETGRCTALAAGAWLRVRWWWCPVPRYVVCGAIAVCESWDILLLDTSCLTGCGRGCAGLALACLVCACTAFTCVLHTLPL